MIQTSSVHDASPAQWRTRILVAGLIWLAAAGGPARAQALTDSFQGLAGPGNEPITIEADTLEVRDNEKIAVFNGNVHVVQGLMNLRSKSLRIDYKSAGKDFGKSEISRIEARGEVKINNGDTQGSTSEWAIFDVDRQIITVGGNVTLTQEKNTIKGDKLIIDLTTKKSRFLGAGPKGKGGRVKGIFIPKKAPEDSPGKPKK